MSTLMDSDVLDADLELEPVCDYKQCGAPADVQAAIHLLNNGEMDGGCATQSVFMCQPCLDRFIEGQRDWFPRRCACGPLRSISDVVLWTRGLR